MMHLETRSKTWGGTRVERISRAALALGALMSTWGVIMVADSGNNTTVWHVLEIAGASLVVLSFPCYLFARFTRQGGDSD